MNKKIMLAVVVTSGLATLAYAQTSRGFQPLEIPGIGWSPTLDTNNAVKVHESTNLYICRITQNAPAPDYFITKVMFGTAGIGYTPNAGMCAFVITEDISGNPVTSTFVQGAPYFLTGKDYFKWEQYNGSTPANAVSGGTFGIKPAYICRANLGVEGYKAGIYDVVSKKCTIAFKGTLPIDSFDILVFKACTK